MKLIHTLARLGMMLPMALAAHTNAHALKYEVQAVTNWGYPSAPNDLGQVVGSVLYPATEGPASNFLFDSARGELTRAPILLDGSNGYVGINNKGQILTRDGVITNGVLTPHAAGVAWASGLLNDTGQYTGMLRDAEGMTLPFLASNGQATALGSIKGYGSAVNNAGMVAGTLQIGDTNSGRPNYHAFVYANGSVTDIGVLAPRADDNDLMYGDFGERLGPYSEATAINDQGTVVGRSNGHMFTYRNGVMTALPSLQGATYSIPQGINELGQIVGNSNRGAFIYSDGQIRPIKDLLITDEGSPEFNKIRWGIHYVVGINDRGQISAIADRYEGYSMEQYAVILNPVAPQVPEAPAALLAIVGTALVGSLARRRRVETNFAA